MNIKTKTVLNSRNEIAALIYTNLLKKKEDLKHQFEQSKNTIGYFFIDELLPETFAKELYKVFPTTSNTVLRKNIREHKYVGYQMNTYHSLLEETLFAFQDERIVQLISEICNLKEIHSDEFLYAGGLSLMQKGNYLNPHLDNSHDKDRQSWRVLNLLYYVTPDWKLENGGNLELWPYGIKNEPITIENKFNRLIVMVTHQKSWHSVSTVNVDKTRTCISNYYFSNTPVLDSDDFHVTTFRGRPNEKTKNTILRFDSFLRNSIRKLLKKGVRENPHQYKK